MSYKKIVGVIVAVSVFIPLAAFADSPVPGCTNVHAINYSSLATIDDGSCIIRHAHHLPQTYINGVFVGYSMTFTTYGYTIAGTLPGNH